MVDDDERTGRGVPSPGQPPPPSREECVTQARRLMAEADATQGEIEKAALLRQAGEWLERGKRRR